MAARMCVSYILICTHLLYITQCSTSPSELRPLSRPRARARVALFSLRRHLAYAGMRTKVPQLPNCGRRYRKRHSPDTFRVRAFDANCERVEILLVNVIDLYASANAIPYSRVSDWGVAHAGN